MSEPLQVKLDSLESKIDQNIVMIQHAENKVKSEYHTDEYCNGWYIHCVCGLYHLITLPREYQMDIVLLTGKTNNCHDYTCSCGHFVYYSTNHSAFVSARRANSPQDVGKMQCFIVFAFIVFAILVIVTNH
jgi:hypothetical protein